ncbi:unnamed protein product [Lactuca saligna]|uniref:Increased DNA methylation 1 C-terminal domain-containing protein n=1 Tax=Lactuca saligna TaxID=75948 RepID=A0AA35Y817_LACSI|nr:unnamed protein product [Lactuca saligna]
MEFGKSFTLCQLEAWSVEYKVRRGATWTLKVEEIDENDDSCGLCGDGDHEECRGETGLERDLTWFCGESCKEVYFELHSRIGIMNSIFDGFSSVFFRSKNRSEFARLNYEGFYTVILEKNDVILCEASLRIYGVNVAETP